MAGTPTTTVQQPFGLVSRLPEPVRLAALALAVVAVEVVLGASLVEARLSRLLLLFVAVIGLAFVFRFPMAATLAIFGFTDFIFYAGFFPSFGLGPLNAEGYELILATLLLVAIVRPRRRTWGGPAGALLAAFLAIVVTSGLIAIFSGRAELTDVFNWGRQLGLLTMFYVVIRLFPDAEQRKLLLSVGALIAAITGVVALMVAFGWGAGEVLKGSGTQIVREEEGVGGIQRVRLPGLSVAYALFWYVAAQAAATVGVHRWRWSLLLMGIALNIVVSFNRNMWTGVMIGLMLMLVLGGAMLRTRLIGALAVAIAGIVLVSAVSPEGQDRLITPIVKRGSTILNPREVSREGSYQDRERETTFAWETAKQNPLLGVGVGAEFGVWSDERIGLNSYVRIPQLFLHNQYLYLLLIGGIPGLLAFVGFLGWPILLALRRQPRDLPITTCAIGIGLIMISSAVAIYFTVEDMTVMLGTLAGVIVADAEGRAADGLDSGLGA